MSKQINAPWPSNGVYGEDGVFYPNGSTPPKEAGEFDNPRVYAGGDEPEVAAQVVGAPTPEQIAAAEDLAKRQQLGAGAADQGGGDDDGAKPAKKAAAKKATPKKATAKRASSSS